MKVVLNSWTPKSILGTHRGSMEHSLRTAGWRIRVFLSESCHVLAGESGGHETGGMDLKISMETLT